MSEETPNKTMPVPAMPSPFRLVYTLGLIAMLSGFTIVLIHEITAGPIERNHRAARQQAVLRVLDGAVEQANFIITDDDLRPATDAEADQANLFAGYAADGTLIGVAIEASSRGYAGEVRILYGYAPDLEEIIGYTVLQSSETPGLGDKIEKDPRFLANFDGLDVQLASDGNELEHPIELVGEGKKEEPWQIDGISGSTVSSRAVANALRESTRNRLPVIRRHLKALTLPQEGTE